MAIGKRGGVAGVGDASVRGDDASHEGDEDELKMSEQKSVI